MVRSSSPAGAPGKSKLDRVESRSRTSLGKASPPEMILDERDVWIRVSFVILWVEVVVNVLNGVWTLINPASAMELMTRSSSIHAFSVEGGEAVRWFAGVGIAFGGYLLARVLLLSNSSAQAIALKPLLEALLVGDILYLSSLVPFSLLYSRAPGIYAPYTLTLMMFIARFYLRFFAPTVPSPRR